jgi:hypothetical protein
MLRNVSCNISSFFLSFFLSFLFLFFVLWCERCECTDLSSDKKFCSVLDNKECWQKYIWHICFSFQSLYILICISFSQLNKAGQQLKILPHKVYNDKEEVVELCSSVECKGIIGNDGRHYILDLLRTFPPDVNFLKRKFILKNYRVRIEWVIFMRCIWSKWRFTLWRWENCKEDIRVKQY